MSESHMSEQKAGISEKGLGLINDVTVSASIAVALSLSESDAGSAEHVYAIKRHGAAVEVLRDYIASLESAAASQQQEAGKVTGETSDGFHTFNELYEHRHALFSVLCRSFGGWKSRLHADGTMFDGWFIAGIQTPAGQITYHLPEAWWLRFRCIQLPNAPTWDSHTAADVIERVQTLELPE